MTDGSFAELYVSSMHAPSETTDGSEVGDDGAPGPENHRALVFESPCEQLSAVIPFVRQGLEGGERVVFIADATPMSDLVESFERAGIDARAALDAGDLCIEETTASYGGADRFDIEEMLDYLEETATEAVAQDYEGVRITGEMTWALRGSPDTREQLVEYEVRLNEFLPDLPITGLCQYDRTAFPPDLLHDIIRAHPHQVYDATVTQNFTYVSPTAYFESERRSVGDAFIDAHLDRVRAHARRQEHESTIAALSESSRNLLTGDAETVVEHALDAVEDVLTPTIAAYYTYEEATNDLHPERVRLTGRTSVDPDAVQLPDEYHRVLREVFAADEARAFEHVQSGGDVQLLDTVVQSGLVVPFDRHGVLLVASTHVDWFDESDAQFVSTLSNATTAALHRVDRDAELRARTRDLEDLERLNRTIRRIDTALVQATGRDEVERVVCEELAATETYQFAWIGAEDELTHRFRPRAWAGSGEAYLVDLFDEDSDTATDSPPAHTPACPATEALETGDPLYVPNVLTVSRFASWRQTALAHGFQGHIGVPLVHDSADYGVLSVYTRDPNPFSDQERAVLAELGRTIAHAIDAAETKTSLQSDRITEVEVAVQDETLPVQRLAHRVGDAISITTILPTSEDAIRVFFAVPGAPGDDVLPEIESVVGVRSARHIADRASGSLFEVTLDAGAVVPPVVPRFSGSVRNIEATPTQVEFTIELPQTAPVSDFADAFTAEYASVDVTAIKRRTRAVETRGSIQESIQRALTDRQLELLQLAYHSGYFESPRSVSAKELAARLSVSQPTVSGHLRAAERKIFELLFDD